MIIAGHIASDSLGLNLLLDKLQRRQRFDILECSGFKRIKRKFPIDYLEKNPHYVQEFSGFTDLYNEAKNLKADIDDSRIITSIEIQPG